MGGFTSGKQFFLRVVADRLDTVLQVVPIIRDRMGTWQMRGHADNCDIGFFNTQICSLITH